MGSQDELQLARRAKKKKPQDSGIAQLRQVLSNMTGPADAQNVLSVTVKWRTDGSWLGVIRSCDDEGLARVGFVSSESYLGAVMEVNKFMAAPRWKDDKFA